MELKQLLNKYLLVEADDSQGYYALDVSKTTYRGNVYTDKLKRVAKVKVTQGAVPASEFSLSDQYILIRGDQALHFEGYKFFVKPEDIIAILK